MYSIFKNLKKSTCILWLMLSTLCLNSQILEQVDSLIKVTNEFEDDKEKIKNYIMISELLYQYDLNKSIYYAYKTINLSKKINYQSGIAHAYLKISQIFRTKNDYLSAIVISYKALEIFEKENNQEGIAVAKFELGYIYKFIPNYSKAESVLNDALQFTTKIKDTIYTIKCEIQLGHINIEKIIKYNDTSYFKEALKHYNRVLQYELVLKDNVRISSICLNLSNAYIMCSKTKYNEQYLQKGIKYSLEGIKYAKLENNILSEGTNYFNIGDAYFIKKDYSNAYKHYTIAYNKIKTSKNNIYLSEITLAFIKLNLKTLKLADAKKLLDEYFILSILMHDKLATSNYYEQLSEYYLLTNNFKDGYHARLKHEIYKDSIIDEEKRNAVVNIEMQYKVNQKEQELYSLLKEKELTSIKIEQEKTIKFYLISSVILIIILFALFLNRYLIKTKSSQIIESKNKELETLSIVTKEARNGILITNEKGIVEWYNEEFSKIHNLNKVIDLESKKSIYNISKNNYINSIIDECIETKKTKEYELNFDLNGTSIWIKTNITPIINSNNIVHKLVFVETDISELIKAKETAENALLLQEQFLANTSHEIRTPMNGIIGMTNQILTTNVSKEQIEYLNYIKESSNNLMYIINGILDVSKIKAGKLDLEKIPFKTMDIFNSIKHTFNLKAIEKKIDFNILLDPTLPQILKGDPTRLLQILINFLNNAIKFTEIGSVILHVNVEKIVDSICTINFRIIDTGIGIAPEKINHIFEAFSQAESNTNRIFGGTGLGLSISKSLIELLGGKIEVTSKINEGSEFYFSLDYEIGNKIDFIESIKIAHRLPENIDLNHLKILMVEDNLINQKVSLFLLNKWKINTDVASNPIEAFELLKLNKYDLILMDLSMPIMSGIEATIKIREDKDIDIRNIPIVALTASALNSEKIKCLEAGMDDYISKPFNAEILYSKILKWTDNKIT